jgi:ferredoxin-type protein NapG/ferredoxin-type protein NapH
VNNPGEQSRRSFFRSIGRGLVRSGIAVGTVGAIVAVRRGSSEKPSEKCSIEVREKGILRPPGALEEVDFLASCSRCNLCAQVCETNCIRFFGPGRGQLAGTPHIVAEHRACNLCLECTQVCPTGALAATDDKRNVRMGEAVIDKRLCVSHDHTGVCGACHTACPLRNRAITQGIRNAPTVDPEQCVGCGMCEEVCIVDDRKAIRIVSGREWT